MARIEMNKEVDRKCRHNISTDLSDHIVTKVGNIENGTKKIRIVHISDTHMQHNRFLPNIPDGDILVHSGDFCRIGWKRLLVTPDNDGFLRSINEFFEKLPHKHKIFVAGNHDMVFDIGSCEEVQKKLPNVTYLQDSSVSIEGINFHGSPWTLYKWTSYNRGFCRERGKIEHFWDKISADTNVLITHLPPHGIMDTFPKKFQLFKKVYLHGGCPSLRKTIHERVRPELHLYGHAHGVAGVESVDETVFSNAAFPHRELANVFDYYI